jgi:hypothetical protein
VAKCFLFNWIWISGIGTVSEDTGIPSTICSSLNQRPSLELRFKDRFFGHRLVLVSWVYFFCAASSEQLLFGR